MSLGRTWWHGAIVRRQDSYGPEAPVMRRRESFEEWEASEAWKRKRWALDKEADRWLRGEVSQEDSGADDLLLLVLVIVIVST